MMAFLSSVHMFITCHELLMYRAQQHPLSARGKFVQPMGLKMRLDFKPFCNVEG